MTVKEAIMRRMGQVNEEIVAATLDMHKTLVEHPVSREDFLLGALATIRDGASPGFDVGMTMKVEMSAHLLIKSYLQAQGNLEKMEDYIRLNGDKQRESAIKLFLEQLKA